jgi:hypothetical protein
MKTMILRASLTRVCPLLKQDAVKLHSVCDRLDQAADGSVRNILDTHCRNGRVEMAEVASKPGHRVQMANRLHAANRPIRPKSKLRKSLRGQEWAHRGSNLDPVITSRLETALIQQLLYGGIEEGVQVRMENGGCRCHADRGGDPRDCPRT